MGQVSAWDGERGRGQELNKAGLVANPRIPKAHRERYPVSKKN